MRPEIKGAYLLRERRKEVQNEGIEVRAQFSNKKRNPVRHETGYEMDVGGKAVQLGDRDRAPQRAGPASAALSCELRSNALLPFALSTSTISAAISNRSSAANRATPPRWAAAAEAPSTIAPGLRSDFGAQS